MPSGAFRLAYLLLLLLLLYDLRLPSNYYSSTTLVLYNKKWWRVGGVCARAVATVATSWVSSGVALGPVQAPAPTPGAGFAVKLV